MTRLIILALGLIPIMGCGSKKTTTPEDNARPQVQLPNNQQQQPNNKAQQPWQPLPFPKMDQQQPNSQQPGFPQQPFQPPVQQPPLVQPINPNPGVINGVRGAVNRTVTQNEFNNLRLFIDTASLASGEMPSPQVILQAAQQSGDKKLAEAIADGTIVLTGTKSREGVWAYERNAITAGGIVLKSDGIQRMTAQQLQQELRNQ